jgi:membrane-bound metal-dependent hydrolase YbcI (DUF457 family)
VLGKTHRAGGTFAMLLTFTIMKQKGLLLPEVNDFVQLAVMYPICSWGSIAPDLDHGKDSIPDKDPISIFINKLLRLSGSKHRSWQTHCILLTGGLLFILFMLLHLGSIYLPVENSWDWKIIRMLLTGLSVGIASHLILDMFSTAGVHLWPGFKLRFVPKTSAFSTGSTWETIVFYILVIGIIVLVINILLGVFGISLIDKLKLFL